MKLAYVWTVPILLLWAAPLIGKPPASRDTKPVPSPTPATTPNNARVNPTAAWLLAQDGGKDAITLPLGEVLHALTHQPILPFDPANPDDAAFLTKLGGVMDRVLPLMNRPDSPTHAAARAGKVDEIAACFEDEIRSVAHGTPGFTPQDYTKALTPGRGYPAAHLVDAKSGKSYYLAVTLYPEGKRENATRTDDIGEAMWVLQGPAIRQIIAGGCCLLVGVEHHGTPGEDLTFLNWDVTDVANVPVRAAITFQAEASDVYHPGAVLTDGRKGSD